VNYEKMKDAMLSLSEMILIIQGDGDYEKAEQMIEEKGYIREHLQKDLDRINEAGIPRDIVFEQGAKIFGS
jgi:predicted DNA-binding transcriptional regulator YafY